ncbi:phosphoribosyltransferase-like protein [Chryseobacterium sp. Mn2064]|uniref:phosphoribosyltransferase-like protein n=1 Tax=Chryseobacterium sp. Mn2064 TaxID=3395263 RepID=UPI003BD3B254
MSGNFEFTRENIRQVELLLPKLKYSVLPTDIIRWLENFEDKDIPHALDILKVFEYISFNEFMNRINSLLKEAFKLIPINERAIIFPYGKVGKSGTLVTYPLSHTNTYKRRERVSKANLSKAKKYDHNIITHDLKNISNPNDFKHIIFLDDFIGSGKTFVKAINDEETKKWLNTYKLNSYFLLSSIIMNEGEKYISSNFPKQKLIICGERRYKAFDPENSVFKLFNNNIIIKDLVKAYGNKIIVNYNPPLVAPLGYDNSESLISFFHGTPNNTLSIIWGDNSWKPLYPRVAELRISEASKYKRSIKYLLLLCEKLGIDIFTGIEKIDNLPDNRTEDTKKRKRQNHSIVALLNLKSRGYENIYICQLLGLTKNELHDVYIEARNKKLINSQYTEITRKGLDILKEMRELSSKYINRREIEENFLIKEENSIYIPYTFMGMK